MCALLALAAVAPSRIRAQSQPSEQPRPAEPQTQQSTPSPAADEQPSSPTAAQKDASAAPSQQDATAAATSPSVKTTAAEPRPPYPGMTAEEKRKQEVAAECASLLKLATDLKAQVDKTSKDELSVTVVRKAAELEQMAHKVRNGTALEASDEKSVATH